VLRVLQEVDLILAEDTRHSGQLLHHYQISKPLDSLHEHNEKDKTEKILAMLRGGQKIALISDAGMPGISDPGAWLIKEVIAAGLSLQVLPGANAALVAYLQSGFLTPHFLYYGFLPRRSKDRIQALEELRGIPFPLIFYEAPHRLKATLEDLRVVLGDRSVSISRELTKRFEETKRGSLTELIEFYQEHNPRGEFVVTVDGAQGDLQEKITEDDVLQSLKTLISSGLSRKTAINQISAEYRLPKNRVYELALMLKSED
jgi:16S rRNA (cytidine1402-2'-O)-methyltransferase